MPSDYTGQRIVILGLARQGLALARYLAQAGAQVVVSDAQPAEKLEAALAALADLKIEYALGGHPFALVDRASLVCLSGGVSADLPLAQEARRRGVPLSNDSQIFLEHVPAGVKTVGITGSAGKTTTTTLVGKILDTSPLSRALGAGEGPGVMVFVGGNIGHPLIGEVERMSAGDIAVMELSSFQLEIMTRSPQIGAILNITPNHLDRHGTMEAYIAAKHNLLRYLPEDGIAVLGWDDSGSRNLNVIRGRAVYFSANAGLPEGAFLRDEDVVWSWDGREQAVCPVSDIRLRGQHNVLNVLAACAISGVAGAQPEQMRAAIADFTGVEHRLEFVAERGGAKWYNDSIASAPERVVAALNSFTEPVVVLLGGRDKKLPWADLARLVKTRVKHTVLFGEAGPLIEKALVAAEVDRAQYTRCERLREAVNVAASKTKPGDVVLLSPGCTSFDEFKDFAERGEKFKDWVRNL